MTIKYIIFLSLMIFASVINAGCIKISGTGTCISDSTNGCHVSSNTGCRTSDTPSGCMDMICSSSCPTSGYYVPYGSSTAWTAFTTNKPSTMTVISCACSADGTICTTNGASGYPACSTCCNQNGPGSIQCSNNDIFGRCGPSNVSCPGPCSGGCLPVI